MNRSTSLVLIALVCALIIGGVFVFVDMEPEEAPTPPPTPVIVPQPPAPQCPGPDCPDNPQPRPKPKPWGPRGAAPVGAHQGPCDCGCKGEGNCDCGPSCPCVSYHPAGEAQGRTDPQTGRPIQIDLPAERHRRNLPDGGGCCVFASGSMGADWHNIPQLMTMLDDRLGGGWPQKVDQVIARKYPGFKDYVQAEGRENVTRLLDWALPSGRIAMVTFGRGHMVNCVHLDQSRGAILDNNRPGVFQWMSREQLLAKIMEGGWAWTYLTPPPPPVPIN